VIPEVANDDLISSLDKYQFLLFWPIFLLAGYMQVNQLLISLSLTHRDIYLSPPNFYNSSISEPGAMAQAVYVLFCYFVCFPAKFMVEGDPKPLG
jgi:hypothetical protein